MMRGLGASAQRCTGDRGQVGGIEALPFGFLVFVALALLAANVWGVVDAKLAVTSAAREGARAYAESDGAILAEAAAEDRARATLRAFGRDLDRATFVGATPDRAFGRCARVRVTVRYRIPAIAIPFLGGFGTLGAVESTFTEVVDPFRNGLAGPARC